MQVKVEALGKLERTFNIKVPKQEVEAKYKAKIKELCDKTNLPGFRKGQVTEKVILMRFGKQVKAELFSELVGQYLEQALTQEKLEPIQMPDVQPVRMEVGHDLEFNAKFEIFPEIELKDINNLSIEKLTAEITDEDLNKMLEKMQRSNSEYIEKDSLTALNDRVIVNLKEALEGEEFPDEFVKDMPIELIESPDTSRVIPGLIDGLIGKKTSDKVELRLKFPENWHDTKMVNKTVNYIVEITKVETVKIPELNDEFAKKYYDMQDGVDGLKKDVKKSMQSHIDTLVKKDMRDQALVQIKQMHEVDIPKSMIDSEIDALRKQEQQMQKQQGGGVPQESAEELESIASDRVKLSLIVKEIIKQEKLDATEEEVYAQIAELFSTMPDKQQLMSMVQNNQQMLAQVKHQVLIDKASDLLLDKANKTDKNMSYNEIIAYKRDTNN